MQAAIARGARCPKIRRATFGCPAGGRVRVARSLSGGVLGARCSGAREDPRPRPGVARANGQGQGRSTLRPGAPAPASASASPGENEKRGSVAGAVALIVGTSIGSGILAVPQRTAPAGFVPSAACMVTCWAFLVAEALLIAEINVHLRQRRNKYLFLAYTSMVAYASKSGEVLSRLVPGGGVPEPVAGAAFTAALAMLVAGGGTVVTDRVNQLLTFVMIGLLLTIEVSAVALGGGLSLPANANWEQVPAALPVIIFTLVFHDIAPVICAYLEGDLARIRLSILVGSLVPLVSLLVWDDIALGLSTSTDLAGFDVLDMLKTEWSHTVLETFSLLAVGTSLIGTLLGASQFFIEQMTNSIASSPARQQGKNNRGVVEPVLEKNMLSYAATGIVVVPTMLIAATVPNSFSIATDIAGGYCMTILYGVLPPLMAWAIGSSKLSDSSAGGDDDLRKENLTSAKPVLVDPD